MQRLPDIAELVEPADTEHEPEVSRGAVGVPFGSSMWPSADLRRH
jgi:hypothetical protein